MKYIPTIILGAVTLFFGIYAMILELNGISPLDQLLWCMLFGLLTYWSRSFSISDKGIALFRKEDKESRKIEREVFDYFMIDKTNEETLVLGDFADKNFSHWLGFIHGVIQKSMAEKPLEGIKIENYITMTMYIHGQRVDIALIKDGKKGPHELLNELKQGEDNLHE